MKINATFSTKTFALGISNPLVIFIDVQEDPFRLYSFEARETFRGWLHIRTIENELIVDVTSTPIVSLIMFPVNDDRIILKFLEYLTEFPIHKDVIGLTDSHLPIFTLNRGLYLVNLINYVYDLEFHDCRDVQYSYCP